MHFVKSLNDNSRIRRAGAFSCLASLSLVLTGCGGGATISPPSPALYAGHYTGTFTATYDPRAPLSGTITGPVNFTVDASGAVILQNPYPYDPNPLTGTGTVSSTGAITAAAGGHSFGIRSLTGQLSRGSFGSLSGSGALTVISSSEVAYGTWQASVQPSD